MALNYKTTGRITFTSKVSDVATTPTAITVRVYKPDGTALWAAKTVSPGNGGTGINYYDLTAVELDTIGRWEAHWVWSSGSSSSTDIEEFWVQEDTESTSGNIGLCTLQQVKAYPNVTTTNDDQRIADLIMAATKTICRKYQREFVPQASATRTFKLTSRFLDLVPYDLRSVTTMKIHPEATSPTTLTVTTDYILEPIGSEPNTSAYRAVRLSPDVDLTSDYQSDYGFAQLEINGAWGIWATESSVPEDIRQAAITTVLSWYDRTSASIASVLPPDGRQDMPGLGGTWAIPNSAHQIFSAYQRFNGIA